MTRQVKEHMVKRAIVTGGSRGIGRAIAAALADAGCDLLLAARGQQALQQAASEIAAASGRKVWSVAADLATAEGVAAVASCARAVFAEAGGKLPEGVTDVPLDVLVNNAGATARGSLLQLTQRQWIDGFALKFHGAAQLCRAVWPMLAAAGGSVINIAGVAGRTPTADFVLGSAVNAAVMSLTKSLAQQGAADGVRVNCINPGLIATGRLAGRITDIAMRDGVDEASAARKLAAEWGVSRIGQPAEIASLAVFLTVGGGTYCQGGIFDVDGGATRGL